MSNGKSRWLQDTVLMWENYFKKFFVELLYISSHYDYLKVAKTLCLLKNIVPLLLN